MRLIAFLVISVGALMSCSGVASVPPGPEDDAVTFEDIAPSNEENGVEQDLSEDVTTNDEGVSPDVPKTCEQVLDKWQCISPATCLDWKSCLGVGGCAEPPCWGLCAEYPGTCLPLTVPQSCDEQNNCNEGKVCVGHFRGTGGEVVPGLCRSRPSKDACYEDAHCPAGMRCVGEAVCGLDSPCLGPEYPGRCLKPPPSGRCFEDADCPAGMRCLGARLCDFEGDDCPGDEAGTCGVEMGCWSDDDCKASGIGGFCVGAFRCRKDVQCVFLDVPGFCAPAPGLRRCWQEDHCGGDFMCRAALLCAPGTICQARGVAHPGICGEPPREGEGITLSLEGNEFKRDVPFRAILVNQGPVPLFLDPCFTAVVQFREDSDPTWRDSWIPQGRHPSCSDKSPTWPVAPGSGVVVTFTVDVPGTYRVQVPYRLGCEQGVLPAKARCRSGAMVVNSVAFTVL